MKRIADIENSMVEFLKAYGQPPEFILVTNEEWAEIKSDPEILRCLSFKSLGMADELLGLPVVIKGSTQHVIFQQQKRRALTPNARIERLDGREGTDSER